MRTLAIATTLVLVACGKEEAIVAPETTQPGNDAAVTPDAPTSVDDASTDAGASVDDASPDVATDAARCAAPPVTDPCDCRAGRDACAATDECAPLASCTAPFRYDPGACFKDFRLSGADDCAPSADGSAICCASFF